MYRASLGCAREQLKRWITKCPVYHSYLGTKARSYGDKKSLSLKWLIVKGELVMDRTIIV